jgi:hypothetical protein
VNTDPPIMPNHPGDGLRHGHGHQPQEPLDPMVVQGIGQEDEISERLDHDHQDPGDAHGELLVFRVMPIERLRLCPFGHGAKMGACVDHGRATQEAKPDAAKDLEKVRSFFRASLEVILKPFPFKHARTSWSEPLFHLAYGCLGDCRR